MENCTKFLETMKNKFHIQEPRDWGKITVQQIQKNGGRTLLLLYGNSLFACLQSIYNGFFLLI